MLFLAQFSPNKEMLLTQSTDGETAAKSSCVAASGRTWYIRGSGRPCRCMAVQELSTQAELIGFYLRCGGIAAAYMACKRGNQELLFSALLLYLVNTA